MRHLRLLKKNYDHRIYAYRTSKGNPVPGITNIYELEEALELNPDIAFITNPTSLHIETAITCLKAGIKNLFIEKPLSNTLKNLDMFSKEVKNSSAIIYVGYCMRHNPVLKRLKALVDERRNQIYYAQTINSSYLPNWRPGRDYRSVYSAKKEFGGGIIFELIHEFDYNEWFFGKIKSIRGIYGKISDLEIETEDFCDVNLHFERNTVATIHLDYFSYNIKRLIRLLTTDEEIIADMVKKEIIIKSNNEIKKENFNFERDDYFKYQLKYFLDAVENQSKSIDNLEDAKDLLVKLIEFKKNNAMIIHSNK